MVGALVLNLLNHVKVLHTFIYLQKPSGKAKNFLQGDKNNDAAESFPLLLSEFPYKVISRAYLAWLTKWACLAWVNAGTISHCPLLKT